MTQVPLKILITDSQLVNHPDIKEQLDKLQKAGHFVTVDESLSSYDFITGPNCWLLRPEVAGLFTIAITNARKIANADQERVDKNKAARASKKSAKSTGSTSKRGRKAKGASERTGERPSTVDPVTNITTNPGGL